MTPYLTELHLPDRLTPWVPYFRAASICFDIDAALLAAICDRESLGGAALTPKGPGGKGDKGHGHGLMQIDDGTHGRFLAATAPDGKPLWTKPYFNIGYAAALLRFSLDQAHGDLLLALAAYNCGMNRAIKAQAHVPSNDYEGRVKALDAATAGGSYVSDVLARRDRFLMSNPNA